MRLSRLGRLGVREGAESSFKEMRRPAKAAVTASTATPSSSALIRHRQPSFDDGASNHGSIESRERRERERILEIHLSHGAVGSMEHAAARDRARHGTARYRAW